MSIEKISKIDYWNPTLWEFSFGDAFEDIKFYVKNISIPQIVLTKEQRNTGHSYYTGYEPESDFSITFIDNKDLQVYNYLKSWLNDIFDYQTRTFKSGTGTTKNGVLMIQKDGDLPGLANAFLKKDVLRTTVLKVEFVNMMLLGVDVIELDYENGEGKTITANFECDAIKEYNPNINTNTGTIFQEFF